MARGAGRALQPRSAHHSRPVGESTVQIGGSAGTVFEIHEASFDLSDLDALIVAAQADLTKAITTLAS